MIFSIVYEQNFLRFPPIWRVDRIDGPFGRCIKSNVQTKLPILPDFEYIVDALQEIKTLKS